MTSDPCATDLRMVAAKYSEIRDLIRHGTFKVILKEEIPKEASVLTVRSVLAIKSTVDGEIKFKARYVAGGLRDEMKDYLVHGAQKLQATYVCLILALSSMLGFKVWYTDVKLEYL